MEEVAPWTFPQICSSHINHYLKQMFIFPWILSVGIESPVVNTWYIFTKMVFRWKNAPKTLIMNWGYLTLIGIRYDSCSKYCLHIMIFSDLLHSTNLTIVVVNLRCTNKFSSEPFQIFNFKLTDLNKNYCENIQRSCCIMSLWLRNFCMSSSSMRTLHSRIKKIQRLEYMW